MQCMGLNFNHNNYVIVIARGQGFMAVNRPESEGVIVIVREPGIYGSKPTESEDKVGLRCHKSMATRAITVIYPI